MLDDLAGTLGIGRGWGARALARAIHRRGLNVAALTEPVARALEQLDQSALRAPLAHGRVPLEDGVADALCIAGLPSADVAPALLGECARVVRNQGRVLVATAAGGLTRRGPERAVVAALLLHAGLVDLEQRIARGIVITSGKIRR